MSVVHADAVPETLAGTMRRDTASWEKRVPRSGVLNYLVRREHSNPQV